MSKVELANIPEKGISANYEVMNTGEIRFRLTKNDGTGYIKAEGSGTADWQNAHYHKTAIETYIIQKGWIAMVLKDGDSFKIKILKENDVYTVQPNIIHNTYMSSYAMVHTVKHGKIEPDDWYFDEEFDKLTKRIKEEDLLTI